MSKISGIPSCFFTFSLCLCPYFFLKSDTTKSKTTAPMKAQIKLPKILDVCIPSKSKILPPTIPPTIPRTKLITRPKPLPFMNNPAKKPAARPIKINQIQEVNIINNLKKLTIVKLCKSNLFLDKYYYFSTFFLIL